MYMDTHTHTRTDTDTDTDTVALTHIYTHMYMEGGLCAVFTSEPRPYGPNPRTDGWSGTEGGLPFATLRGERATTPPHHTPHTTHHPHHPPHHTRLCVGGRARPSTSWKHGLSLTCPLRARARVLCVCACVRGRVYMRPVVDLPSHWKHGRSSTCPVTGNTAGRRLAPRARATDARSADGRGPRGRAVVRCPSR